MDFSKLDQNDKLAVYGAIASIVGPVLASIGFGFGAGFLTLLLALAMLAIVFMPQWSPRTTLPGSKGSLMLIVGGIAAVSAALALIGSLGLLGFFGSDILFVVGWLLGIVGGLLMGWAGWQAFQAEGGKFQLGSAGTTAGPTTAGPTTTRETAPPTSSDVTRTDATEVPRTEVPRTEVPRTDAGELPRDEPDEDLTTRT